MPRKKRPGDYRPIAFKAPVEHYKILALVADARGIDLSALLNLIVSDALPAHAHWLALYRGAIPPASEPPSSDGKES